MPRPANTPDLFWSKVERRNVDKCWPWLKGTCNGYGRLDWPGAKGTYAHRVAYYLTHPGEIELECASRERMVLHTCDNAICCNPAHLYIGSHNENMADKVARNRCPDFRGTRGPRAKLTEDDLMMMRYFKQQGATHRAMALLFDVSQVTIKGVFSGRHYRSEAKCVISPGEVGI